MGGSPPTHREALRPLVKHIDSLGAFETGGEALAPPTRPLEAAPARVRSFSTVSDPDVIRTICQSGVPGWSQCPKDEILVDQICEGLSNQLFKVHVDAVEGITCVLFRIYGSDVGSLYDQDLELQVFRMLSSYQIAPRMYANGDGWRIEEWHSSVPLKTRNMRNPSIFTQVASQVGRLHKLSRRHDFPRSLLALPPASLVRLETWGAGCERAAAALTEPESRRKLAELCVPEVLAERRWLKDFLCSDDPKVRGSGLDIVFSHNDVQENNILQTHYGLRLIDFEYSSMDFQALDLANYFCECTIDYTYDRYPFYTMSLSDFPSESEQRMFCSIYLSEYLESMVLPEDAAVAVLVDRVRRFVLLSHFLWAIWSVIRAPQASTFNEFDFLHYAQSRWDTYKREKTRLLATSSAASGSARTHNSAVRQSNVFVVEGASERTATCAGEGSASASVAGHTKTDASRGTSALHRSPLLFGGVLTAGGVLLGALVVASTMRFSRR